jgi:hypothetical protein
MPRQCTKRVSTQSQRFIDKARELGCNEDEAAFEEWLRKIAKAQAPKDVRPKVTKPKRAK